MNGRNVWLSLLTLGTVGFVAFRLWNNYTNTAGYAVRFQPYISGDSVQTELSSSELLARHYTPGLQLNQNGTASCLMSNLASRLYTPLQCENLIEFFRERVDIPPADLSAPRFDKGQQVVFAGDLSYSCRLEANPAALAGFRAAEQYAQGEIVDTPGFFNRTREEIIDVIKQIHRLMVPQKIVHPGEFRQQCMWINAFPAHTKAEERIAAVLSKGGTMEHAKAALNPHMNFCNPTAFEREAMELIGQFTPHYHEIAARLNHFVDEAKEFARAGYDCVERAAHWHQGIVQIHPFRDRNGSTGRLLMNKVLESCGIGIVVFPNDDEYNKAVRADRLDDMLIVYHSFAEYIGRMIPWTKEAYAILSGSK